MIGLLKNAMVDLPIRAELLEAWLALTIGKAVSKPIRCQGIKRWLTLTMLQATGPRMQENSKRSSGNSLSPLGAQNKDIGTALQTLLIEIKLRLQHGLLDY